MGRIVAPTDMEGLAESNDRAATLHDHTYGITSSPLTQFACAFAALIHDLDHQGVSNAQLVKEEVSIAEYYNNRSVAEQNSLDLSWELLMEARFEKFRSYVFPTNSDLTLFRQLVVNVSALRNAFARRMPCLVCFVFLNSFYSITIDSGCYVHRYR